MSIFVDLILIAVLVLAVLLGRRRGFVRTVMHLVSGIIAFIAAYLFTPPLASLFYEKVFFSRISDTIHGALTNLIGTRDPAAVFADTEAKGALTDIFAKFNVSYEDAVAHFSESVKAGVADATTSVAEYAAAPVANAISYVLSFVLIFVVAIILLTVLTHVLDLVTKLPILKTANRLLGAIAGFIHGLVIVWVITLALRFALPYLHTLNAGMFPLTMFEDSFLLRTIYSLNAFKGVFLNNSFVSRFVK